ncbi:hypothetical protein BDP27DRAFT_1313947 [Rhodocollybia butyracea]|uniref:J domain-containing protein n=1 Tax=Rhodocollybia butyracea TaxID=206335 RepID=A0A9P5Q642_9AGAR|nr:hypothetical protein BDP27DRAFT_1313947 [Rhodocollybia butyracea]
MDKYNEAFAMFGLTPEAEESVTAKAYKKLALQWHPDRNHGRYEESTAKFQEIGAAYEVCQQFYAMRKEGWHSYRGRDEEEDIIELSAEEIAMFYQFLFEEIFAGRYNREKTRQYKRARTGKSGASVFTFSEGFADAQERQQANTARQAQERDEYLARVRDFEREIEAEKAEQRRLVKEANAEAKRVTQAYVDAFQAATKGDRTSLERLVSEFKLDVNHRSGKKATPYTLLLAAAQSTQDTAKVVEFLLGKGADVSLTNGDDLTAFHLACSSGNIFAAKVLLAHKDVHPSRAARNGMTPLQLALKSRSLEMLQLVLKDATVHDVERCWKRTDISDGMRNILESKNGFTEPSKVESKSGKPTRDAQRKLAEEAKRARIKEEERRADVNRQIKLEKAERQKAEDERRRKAKEEEQQQQILRDLEERRRKEKEEKRQLEELASKQKEAKEKERQRLTEEKTRRRRVEEDKRVEQMKREQEKRKEKEQRAKLLAEEERRRRIEEEQKIEQTREEEKRLREAEKREQRRRRRRVEDDEKSVRARREPEQARQRREYEERLAPAAELSQRQEPERKRVARRTYEHSTHATSVQSTKACKEPHSQRGLGENFAEAQNQRELEAARRAEQSARDRARAASLRLKKLEEENKLKVEMSGARRAEQDRTRQQQESLRTETSSAFNSRTLVEDVQTRPTSDDLFEAPRSRNVIPDGFSTPPTSMSTFVPPGYRGRGRGRGRGSRGRGRGHIFARGGVE